MKTTRSPWRAIAAASLLLCVSLFAGRAAALQFDGANDFVNVPDSASVRITGAITIEAWINRAAGGVQHSVVEKYGCAGIGGYVLRVTAADKVLFGTRDDCNIGSSVIGATSIPAGTWTHIAGHWDGAVLRVYVNGVLDGTLATTRNPKAGTTALKIGERGNGGTPFNGGIDEVRLWSVACTGAEIAASRTGCLAGNEAGLAGYWRFEEGAGLTANDLTANANHGTLLNGPNWLGVGAPVSCGPPPPPPPPPTPLVRIFATTASASEHPAATPGIFTVWRTGSTASDLTVNFTVVGTAASGVDYSGIGTSITIPAGSPAVFVPVLPIDDPDIETAETVAVTLVANPAYDIGSPNSATVTIEDNDPTVSIVATEPLASEFGDLGQFTLTRTGPTTNFLLVHFLISGTAINNVDYLDLAAAVLSPPGAFPVITPASVFIPAGEASTIIDVYPYFDDALVEGPETVHLILTNPPGVTYSIGIGEAEVVILDNEMADPPSANTIVSLLATQPATAEAAGGVLPAAFRAFRTGPTGAPLAVNYTLSGSAINGTDYTALPGSVVIPAGLDSAPFFASAIDDALVEGGETVVATLSPSPAYSPGASTTGTVTITDNDPNVNVEATDALASETGGNTGTFRFWRTGPTTTPLAIGIVVTGTANSGSDYAGIGTLAILPPGVSSTNLTVIPSDDSAPEGTESVVVTITAVNDPAYALGRTTATVSITDNDVPLPTPPSVSVTATDASAAEAGLNPAVFTITRTGATNIPLTVNYTLGGGAGNGTDYNLLPLTVQIPVGANSVTRTITPIDDPTFEGTESVVLTLTASPNHTLGTASATANIADNDASLANAVLLDGVNDHISVPDSPSVRITGTITVEAWINRAATGVQHSVVEKYGCSGLGGYVLRVTDANRLMFGTRDDCNIGSSVIGAASIPANTWTHVAGTWDGAALRVYVNGVLDGTLATTRNPKAGTTPLLIGARGNNAGTTFNGRIDEVRLWNVARSGAQILANRNICVPPASAGLAGYWRLDEGAGLGATDATANGNNGALLNGATWSSAAAPVTCAP